MKEITDDKLLRNIVIYLLNNKDTLNGCHITITYFAGKIDNFNFIKIDKLFHRLKILSDPPEMFLADSYDPDKIITIISEYLKISAFR